MTVHNYTNTASVATLDAPLNSSANSFAVSGFTGYPSTPFYVLMDRDTSSAELLEVTTVAGLTLTVTRGVGGTASTSHSAGATIEHVIPASVPQATEQHIEATANIHGVTGALLGADSAGTITNKTFQGAFVHSYSAGTPASPEAGFVVNGDNGIGRDGFVFDGDGANTDRSGFLLTQNGTERYQVFNDGTMKVTPSGSAVRPGIESTTNIRTSDLDVIDDAVVGGDLTVAGTSQTGNANVGNLAVSGTATVGGTTTLNAATVAGALAATASGTGLTVNNTAAIGTLNVTAGNLTLQGTNAKLGLPSSPTLATPGTAAGQVRYRNGRIEVWNGSSWRSHGAAQPETSTNGGADGVKNTTNAVLYQRTISDPGYPYVIAAQGQFEYNDVADGTRWDIAIVLDNPATLDPSITLGLGNGFAQTSLGFSNTLTGTHTIYWVARRAFGSSSVNVTPFSQVITSYIIGV